jgi:hypothetical protein
MSIPVAELKRRLKGTAQVQRDRRLLPRAPFCAFVPEAARYLDQTGSEPASCALAFPDWEAAGPPVEG